MMLNTERLFTSYSFTLYFSKLGKLISLLNFKSVYIHSNVLLQTYALACATCVLRLLVLFRYCCANKQHYRICKHGLVWIVSQRQDQRCQAAVCTFTFSGINQRYRGNADCNLSAMPAVSGGRIGGGTGWSRTKVNFCTSPSKTSGSKSSGLRFLIERVVF